MDDYDDTAQYANDHDDYQDEEEANGHDLDEEDVEAQKMEDALYKSDDEEEPSSEDEFQEDGILGLENEQEDNVDDFGPPGSGAKATKVPKKDVSVKIISDKERKTHPIMTKFEYSYFISQRAIMIEHDSPLMIPDTQFYNAIDIAKEETEKKVNPIIIYRHLPNGTAEKWKCSELQLPKKYI
jgi:DNA-directed RNA polymerase subunit K/omega